MVLANQLFEQYGDAATQAKIAGLEATLKIGPQEIDPLLSNDFRAMEVETKEDIRDRFIPNFYFGCESDDPLACIAFDRRINPLNEQVRAIMSFDLGHWDVTNMDHAAAEAYEQVDRGLFNDEDFKKFGFENSVHLYGDTNPEFFKGTRIETETAKILAGA
jgi:hypothetical protein